MHTFYGRPMSGRKICLWNPETGRNIMSINASVTFQYSAHSKVLWKRERGEKINKNNNGIRILKWGHCTRGTFKVFEKPQKCNEYVVEIQQRLGADE